MSEVLDLTIDLISRNSVTPEDAGCQDLIAERLSQVGCQVQRLDFDNVKNIFIPGSRSLRQIRAAIRRRKSIRINMFGN